MVTVEHRGERLVAVKHGGTEAIEHEGRILTAVQGPGVVPLFDVEDDPAGARLVLDHLGGRTLAAMGPLTVDRALAVARSLLDTVDRLHRLGIVHGRVTADHVLVTVSGPVLIGFSGACRSSDPSEDVRAVVRLLRDTVAAGHSFEPTPTSRWRPVRWSGYRVGAVLTLCDRYDPELDDPDLTGEGDVRDHGASVARHPEPTALDVRAALVALSDDGSVRAPATFVDPSRAVRRQVGRARRRGGEVVDLVRVRRLGRRLRRRRSPGPRWRRTDRGEGRDRRGVLRHR